MISNGIKWKCQWNIRCIDKNGNIVWKEEPFNALADEGAFLILDDILRGDAGATQFYIRLFNDTPVKTDSLSDLVNEASGNGYSAQLVEKNSTGWPTLALDGGDYQATSSEETFSASGGSWGPVTYAVLATSTDSSGKLFAFVALSQARTINDGESLLVTLNVKLS